MSRTFFSLHRKRGYSSRHPVPCQLRGTLDSRVSSCGLLVLLRSISAVPSLISSDDADRVSETGKPCGCIGVNLSTMDLSEARGLVLFWVVRRGIGISQRLSAQRHYAYRPFGYSPSNPSVSRTNWPPPEKDHRRWKGSSPETLKRLAISVCQRRSFLPSSRVSA